MYYIYYWHAFCVLGVITTTLTLDYETQPSHSLNVVACDNGVPRMCGSAMVLINIGDFNDESPEFDQNLYVTDVCYEAAPLDTDLVQPVATDRDSGANAVLKYFLTDQPPLFTIDRANGRVSLASSAADADVGRYTFTILAVDSGASPLTGTAEVLIQVLNCSDIPFYFESPFQYFMINEGTNVFVDSSVSQQIRISQAANSAFFFPDINTNPFANILNVRFSEHFGASLILLL